MCLCDLHHVGRVAVHVELLDPVFVERIVIPDVSADYALFFPDLTGHLVVQRPDNGAYTRDLPDIRK